VKQVRSITRFITHRLSARHTGGFGVHSPFIFDFIKNVLEEKKPYYQFSKIESIRHAMLNDRRSISVRDLGTGNDRERRIADIAEKSLKKPRLAQLLFRIVEKYHCRNITELGTSLGITTLYLASPSSRIQCISFEGCTQTAAVARQNFAKAGLGNISIIEGEIGLQLTKTLDTETLQDLIFIDANHTYEATMEYFSQCLNFCHDKSIIVLDDIYWSEGMTRAWNEIKANQRVRATVDIYYMGFVFLNPELNKQHFKIVF
jgi:predicted O-methyltransferase YrrM